MPPSSPSHAAETDRPIRLGIAGLGLAGAMMIRAARIHPRVVLAAAADPLPRPREAFARDFGGNAHAEFRALCEDPSVEAIYIGTPHQFHPEQAILALAHGKHVLVEKPLALTLAACDTVIAAAERHPDLHLIVGHTHGFDPNVRALRQLVQSGELGRLGMISTFNYTDFLYRPRRPEELDTAQGGGILFNQVSHQIEIVRSIGGGLVRSVRANVGIFDPSRPTEGSCLAFLEFESGAAASLLYSAYDHFDSDELHGWIAESGNMKSPAHGGARRTLRSGAVGEPDRQRDLGYGGRGLPTDQPYLPHFGLLFVSCERGDVRLSADGLLLYGPEGPREVAVPRGVGRPGHGDALDALWAALREGRRDDHDARWGKATLEVILAILRSARERREIMLSHQVAVRG